MKIFSGVLAAFLILAFVPVCPAPAQGAKLIIQPKVTGATTNSVTISWMVVNIVPVKGFEVHRGAGTSGFALMATTAKVPLNYTDQTVQPGVVYSYKIRALLDKPDPSAYSEFSPPVQAVAIPGMPVLSCSERRANTNTTQLSWAAVPGAAGYEVYQSLFERGQFGSFELLAETAAPGYLKSGMADRIDYKFGVRAFVLLNGRKVFGEYSNFVVAKHVFQDSGDGGIAR